MRTLKGEERARLMAALMDAFRTPEEMEVLLHLWLDRSLAALAPTGRDYEYVVFKLLERSDSEGWTPDLILAACAARPGNEPLASVAEGFSLVPAMTAELEGLIVPRNGVHDADAWLGELWRNSRRVCRLELRTATTLVSGTGCLVGPDLVLTNFHVIEPLFLGGAGVASPVARFDARSDPDGRVVLEGRTCPFAEDWLLAFSPHDDAKEKSVAAVDDEVRLDYALLRLGERAGEAGLGAAGAGTNRGWIMLSTNAREAAVDDQTLILQHPGGGPLKLAVDRIVEQDGASVRYHTNTDGGSSGSPCFSLDWQLVALHQGVAPGGVANQGVSARSIAAHILAQCGDDVLPRPGGSA
jgi:hypothetical protein